MNKTVYLRDEEVPVWERARELADDKLSPVIVSALRRFIADEEAVTKGFERIEIRFKDWDDNQIPKTKAFYGRWIFPPSKPLEVFSEEGDETWSYTVACQPKREARFSIHGGQMSNVLTGATDSTFIRRWNEQQVTSS